MLVSQSIAQKGNSHPIIRRRPPQYAFRQQQSDYASAARAQREPDRYLLCAPLRAQASFATFRARDQHTSRTSAMKTLRSAERIRDRMNGLGVSLEREREACPLVCLRVFCSSWRASTSDSSPRLIELTPGFNLASTCRFVSPLRANRPADLGKTVLACRAASTVQRQH